MKPSKCLNAYEMGKDVLILFFLLFATLQYKSRRVGDSR